jgi:CrcB protein
VLALRWLGADFPYGTLLVNVTGSFLVGVVHQVALQAVPVPEDLRLFLATGVLGGFTTYSAFSYETVRLAESGAWPLAWVNVLGTTVACLVMCFLGIAAGRALGPGRPGG